MHKSYEAEPGLRLDVFLCRRLEGASRGFVKKLIEAGKVTVGGERRDPAYKLRPGERVEVGWSEAARGPEPRVLFEDPDLLVLEKPSGLIVHPAGETWLRSPETALAETESSLVSWLLRRGAPAAGLERCGLVHRLDRETSGVMAVAKSPSCQRSLLDQFRERTAQKVYLAVVSGTPERREGTIEAPVGRVGRRLKATPYGRDATSAYKVLRAGKDRSLVEVRPLTGRTHQIRVHLAALGHPVMGDKDHGGPEAPRLMLHAHRLTVAHRGKPQTFVSDAPPEFKV